MPNINISLSRGKKEEYRRKLNETVSHDGQMWFSGDLSVRFQHSVDDKTLREYEKISCEC